VIPTSSRTAAARAAQMHNAALRAAEKPDQLAKAARTVRAAIDRGKLSTADLTGEVVRPDDLIRRTPASGQSAPEAGDLDVA
jgi:predicted component of type VI protein secretion system